MYSFLSIEFDEDKQTSNILKHGIDFTDVEPVFADPRAFTNDRLVDTRLICNLIHDDNYDGSDEANEARFRHCQARSYC